MFLNVLPQLKISWNLQSYFNLTICWVPVLAYWITPLTTVLCLMWIDEMFQTLNFFYKQLNIPDIPGIPSSAHRSSTCWCSQHVLVTLLKNAVHLGTAVLLCSMSWGSGDVSYRFLERLVGGCMLPPPCSIQFTHCYMLEGLPLTKRTGRYLIKGTTVQDLLWRKHHI
jgi:hypothetical protein